MSKQTWWQRLILNLATGCGFAWFALSIAEPFVEYRFGKGPLTILLSRLSFVAIAGIFVTIAIGFVLRWSGVLPSPAKMDIQASTIEWRFSWRFMLVTLGFWILVSFALIAFFVFASDWIPDKRVMDAITNVLPMTLLVAVWIGFLVSMRSRVRRAEKESQAVPPETTAP